MDEVKLKEVRQAAVWKAGTGHFQCLEHETDASETIDNSGLLELVAGLYDENQELKEKLEEAEAKLEPIVMPIVKELRKLRQNIRDLTTPAWDAPLLSRGRGPGRDMPWTGLDD